MRKNDEIREVWNRHFEKVMKESMGGRAEVTTMRLKMYEVRPHTQGRLKQDEILKAIRKLKTRKAPGMHGITAEMLKQSINQLL